MTDLPATDEWLTPPEAERLQGFPYAKRREEARLGRWTAKLTLAGVLGLDTEPGILRTLVVRNASDGAPEVFIDDRPARLSISMTDRADWAVCTVVEGTTSIGCDLEVVEPRSDAFVRDWFTGAEQQLVASRELDHDLLTNLIWSAKESALKVLRTGLRRDTRSVEVTLDGERDERDGWSSLDVTTEEGHRFPGWWTRFGEFVLTFVGADASDPPAELHQPPPLASASPSHSWMIDPLRRTTPDDRESEP